MFIGCQTSLVGHHGLALQPPRGVADLSRLVVVEIDLRSDLKGSKLMFRLRPFTRAQSNLKFFCVRECSNTHMVVLKCRDLW